jgi:hypothetical protein
LITHSRQWINAILPADGSPPEASEREVEELAIATDAFQSANDRLLVEGRPTDRGVRVRFEFQAGYAGWIGRQIARQMAQALGEDE